MLTAPLVIIQGAYRNLPILLSDENGPFSLAAATDIIVIFTKADGTALSKLLSLAQVVIVSALGGKISVALAEVDTALLKVGEKQTVEIRVIINGQVSIAQAQYSISVRAPLIS